MLSDMDKPYGLVALPNECALGMKICKSLSIIMFGMKNSINSLGLQHFNKIFFQLRVRAKMDKDSGEMIASAIKCVFRMEWDRIYAYVEMMTGIVTCRMNKEDVCDGVKRTLSQNKLNNSFPFPC